MTSACLDEVPLPPEAASPRFDPIAFFEGTSHGAGQLSTVTGSEARIVVRSNGVRQPDGVLRLTQHIIEGDKPERTRVWIIRPVSKGRFAGTLTEAVGPVHASVRGNRMDVSYRTPGYAVRQRLVLGKDGKVHNRLDIDKWGLNVARLNETIVRG